MYDELSINEFKIGQKIGVIWRYTNGEKTWFGFKVAKVSTVTITKNGTKIKSTPQLFRTAMEIEEFEDFRELKENGLIMVNTPMLLSDEAILHFEKVVEHWNMHGAKSIIDEMLEDKSNV